MVSMRLRRRRVPFAVAAGLLAVLPAFGQAVCVTPNCVFGDAPQVCKARAAPRTMTVLMGSGGNVFDPPDPRIEPGDCILWIASSLTHSSSSNPCLDDLSCASPSPPACTFETGNVSAASATPSSTCFYDPAAFPPGTGSNYYCRFHASPTAGTMRGTLRVTTPILLLVDKDLGTNSVKLAWTGGGVAGDVSYKVVRQTGDDPTFPAGSTATLNPDGGVNGTTFTAVGELSVPTIRYYLIRNKQIDEI